MKDQDQLFIDQLQGSGALLHQVPMKALIRKGSLLMLLPTKPSHAKTALELYQPQTLVARIYILILRNLLSISLNPLKKVNLTIKSSSPLKDISPQTSLGILLGNPSAPARRAICWVKNGNSESVIKLGMNSLARASVIQETEYLKIASKIIQSAPSVLESSKSDHHASYSTAMIRGGSPNGIESLIPHLTEWHYGVTQPISESVFKKILTIPGLPEEQTKLINSCDKMKIHTAPIHGDFAPWNIKIDSSNAMHVLDWEFFEPNGIAGIDVAHFLLQQFTLTDRLSPEVAIRQVHEWSLTPTAIEYLSKCGWKNYTKEWLGLYLLYTHHLLKIDRSTLWVAWKNFF